MVDFGDPTQWLRLLADREDRELRKQQIALAQQQQDLDNAFRAEGRAMDIAEHTARMAKNAVDSDFNAFNFEQSKKMAPLEFRRAEALAADAEGDLQEQTETKGLRRAEFEADVKLKQMRVKEYEGNQQFLTGFLAPAQQGVADFLGDTPTTEMLARSAWSIGKVTDFVARRLPAKMRAKVDKAGLQNLIGAPIGVHLESRAKAGDLETAGAILGSSTLSDALAPFVSDEARTAAGRAVEQGLQGISSSIASIPDPDYISKVSRGSPGEMISMIDQQIEAANSFKENLNRNVYMLPRFSGDAVAAEMKANEKIVDLARERQVISAGVDVLNGQGVVTPMHREGLSKLVGMRVNEVMWSANPGAAIEELGETIRKANFIPVAEVVPIFDAAITSADPVSQLKASMLWEKLKILMPDQVGDLAKELERKGSFDALETMGDVRRGMEQMEAGVLAMGMGDGAQNPDAQTAMVAYAAHLSDAVSRSIQSRSQEAEAGAAMQKMAGGSGSADKLKVSQFAAVEKYMGANGFFMPWNSGGLLDNLDLSKEEAMAVDGGAMYAFWATDFSRAKGTEARRASFANKTTAGRYHKGSLLGDQKVTANHPYNVAKDKYKREDLDVDFTIDYARYQLQKILDTVTTKLGLPARIMVDDVDASPRLHQDGSKAWEIRRKSQQEMLGVAREDTIPKEVQDLLMMSQAKVFEPLVFQPAFSNEQMLHDLAEIGEVMPGGSRTVGVHPGPGEARLYRQLDFYLGSESPNRKFRVAETERRVQEARRKERLFQAGRAAFVHVPAEMASTPE